LTLSPFSLVPPGLPWILGSGHATKLVDYDLARANKGFDFSRFDPFLIRRDFPHLTVTGINLITYYAATIYEQSIGLSQLNSKILAAANGTGKHLFTFICLHRRRD